MEFKIGAEVLIDHHMLKGHICIIESIKEYGYVVVRHPSVNWQGYTTGFDYEQLKEYNTRLATKLEKAVK